MKTNPENVGMLRSDALRSSSNAVGLVRELMDSGIALEEDWESVSSAARENIGKLVDRDQILARLLEHGLLTEYQVRRISSNRRHGLVLGNYRVLDRLGAGGMGVVFKAEHRLMRRKVAIKVLSLSSEEDPKLLQRFNSEMRAAAQLQHPHIVNAVDAGVLIDSEHDAAVQHYFVMEYVAGQDLEAYVLERGPLSPAVACDVTYQIASALGESHRHQLVHRDVKPANILITPEGQAKLLDFGLARNFRHRMTQPGVLLGTVDYMAPEQARDSSAVDIRADIYGLGGTLYWCLTGTLPFPAKDSIEADLIARLTQQPPSPQALRPEISPELDALVRRMMALNPEERYPTPQRLMQSLLPFTTRDSLSTPKARGQSLPAGPANPGRIPQALIVDDEPAIRTFSKLILQDAGIECDEAGNGDEALAILRRKAYDVVLLDVDMPKMTGPELLRQVRANPPCPYLKIILCSGRATPDDMARMLADGADDFLGKPYSPIQLSARVKAVLRLKDVQDRSDMLNRHLLAVNAEQDRMLTARDSDLLHARNALVLVLARLVEQRSSESRAHLRRLQKYCRYLAEEAAQVPVYAGQIDSNFVQALEGAVPLHDIGTVALPDHILSKPGKLDLEERLIMQSHTTRGAETLAEVAGEYGFGQAFLQMAINICRHHHERWDGEGYPDRLAGEAIPLEARIVSVVDVYDALRSRRSYRPALSHQTAMQMISSCWAGQFDPCLLGPFQRCAEVLEWVHRETPD